MQQCFRLLRRMRLAAAVVLETLRPRADREQPVRAHLQIVVRRLEALVVERVARLLIARRPDQRLVRIGEAAAAEVRHRIDLPPHHVVQDPEAQILQRRAKTEHVVIGADDPQRAVGLQHAAAFRQPRAAEFVVLRERAELVPLVVDAVDARVVRPQKFGGELQDCRVDLRRPDLRLRRVFDEAGRGNLPPGLISGQGRFPAGLGYRHEPGLDDDAYPLNATLGYFPQMPGIHDTTVRIQNTIRQLTNSKPETVNFS